jgi:succinate-semialdehyde dehydrogenase/glutarate-semialdehyde dehydrogenase
MAKMISRNPATGEVNKEFTCHTNSQVEEALKRSRKVLTYWKSLTISERANHLKKAAKILRRKKEELGRIITLEMGKVIKESVPEIEKCAWALDYFADNSKSFLEREIIETDAKQSYVSFEPLGAVLSIMPWNYPFWQALRFGAPALAGGNVVLLKHSSLTPMCALAIEETFKDAGFPEGVYQTLLIPGSRASELISDERINAVSLTGSVAAGQRVGEVAGSHMKKFILELGGSDPFIVLKDADIEAAAKTGVASRFLNAGQSCIAAKRFIVEKEAEKDFTSEFVKLSRNLKVGDPLDPDTDIGPLVREEQATILEEQTKDSLAKGAKALLKGGRIKGKGVFYSPVVLSNVTEDMRVLTEETFGPVAPIVKANDEKEAIKIANNTEFGLGASLWSRDRKRAQNLAKTIESGVVSINSFVKSDPRLPFGGVKKSGIGRELSKFGLIEFMNIKTISVF